MKVQPQAAPYAYTGTAMTVADRRETGSDTSGLHKSAQVLNERPPRPQTSPNVSNSTPVQPPKPSGDVRIDGYTLWAFSDVFKGLVLDVRL